MFDLSLVNKSTAIFWASLDHSGLCETAEAISLMAAAFAFSLCLRPAWLVR